MRAAGRGDGGVSAGVAGVSELATQSVEAMIAEAVGSGRNPGEVAAEIVQSLDEDTLRTLAEESLIRTVQRYLRAQEPKRTAGNGAVNRSTRWGLVCRDVESGDLDLARMTVDTGEKSKPLFDCHYSDLLSASDNHMRFALANEEFAEQYRNLADLLLGSDDARTVRDLPERRVREILSA
jgi:hypothetical protein